jgi:HTH-type transcriptional regulator/antitoxin HigA
MSGLKYKVITSEKQYDQYCKIAGDLMDVRNRTQDEEDELDLLAVLIEDWQEEHYPTEESDPIQFLLLMMKINDMKAKDLVELLGVSKGYVSEILNYKKGLSKEVIRKLAQRFKVRQDALNKPYRIDVPKKKKKPAKKPAKVVSARKKYRKAV